MHKAALEGRMAELQLQFEDCRGEALLTNLDAAGDTALHMAALGGHSRIAKRLVEECAELVHVQDAQGWTALHYAASTGNVGLATVLLDAGAKLVCDRHGSTPAHEAAIKGNAECGRTIVDGTLLTNVRVMP
eukprot:SAG11_NODE_2186_length_3710_cov_1.860426_1_plen_132_part_00